MDKNFGDVIWTNHALQKLTERGIKQGDAWATWRSPQQSRYATAKGAWIYYRTYGNDRIEVVAKKNERDQWIILSVWSRHIYGVQPKESFLTFLITAFKKTPDLKSGDELNADMSSSLRRGNRGLKSVEDVIKRIFRK